MLMRYPSTGHFIDFHLRRRFYPALRVQIDVKIAVYTLALSRNALRNRALSLSRFFGNCFNSAVPDKVAEKLGIGALGILPARFDFKWLRLMGAA